MRCPTCGDEYRADVVVCADCGTALRPGVLGPAHARVGRFHPMAARLVADAARARGLDVQTITHPDGVDVLVDRSGVDEIRADLVLHWDDLLRGLDPDEQAEVLAQGGPSPGWTDPPDGLWVDRQGRILAAEEQDDDGRALGPVLVAGGILLLLVAWYAGEGTLAFLGAVAGLSLVLVGIFSPR